MTDSDALQIANAEVEVRPSDPARALVTIALNRPPTEVEATTDTGTAMNLIPHLPTLRLPCHIEDIPQNLVDVHRKLNKVKAEAVALAERVESAEKRARALVQQTLFPEKSPLGFQGDTPDLGNR